MSKDDWKIYNRGKLHAYSIILDLLDLTNSYDDIKKTVKRLINRHQEEVENIEKLDNADVALVVHGYWKPYYHESVLGRVTDGYQCSKCGEGIAYNEWNDYNFSDYCPNCGAKMDESEGE